jgi:hypothetical protein
LGLWESRATNYFISYFQKKIIPPLVLIKEKQIPYKKITSADPGTTAIFWRPISPYAELAGRPPVQA